MASTFRVEWTEAASSDLEDIVRFIARDSPLNATLVHAVLDARRDLRELAERLLRSK